MLYQRSKRPLPPGLEGLDDLALDLRWSPTHSNDRIWRTLDEETWERTRNAHMILQNAPQNRLEQAAKDAGIRAEVRHWRERMKKLHEQTNWYTRHHAADKLQVAYFSMEFGLSEALPIYSGGLGILAGDHLKTASDMGVPIVGIGLLYQQGYFHQMLSSAGEQVEAFPYNDPTSLPITPVENREGGWLRINLGLPGRNILLRVWQARVGSVNLYLLDSNDPLNGPWERGITANLYPAEKERRLIQEIVLGYGGWRALEALGLEPDVCHINEGHAAFAIIARAVSFMRQNNCAFDTALWATRAGNVFTTHTPVAAGFDRFEPQLIHKYVDEAVKRTGLTEKQLVGLGRMNPEDETEAFNMAFLAVRGSGYINGVSQLHAEVSKKLFQDLFPRWPKHEIPVHAITNGVHIPSWHSSLSHRIWSRRPNEESATGEEFVLAQETTDSDVWQFRAESRNALVHYVRRRLVRQVRQQGASADLIARAHRVLDPNTLTLGFARRFAEYKRPNLLLHNPERLAHILLNHERPVQLIVAGKAHPNDWSSKALVKRWTAFGSRPELFDHVVFLEDYDIALARELAAGIDVWINNPRRPWEACGTSGMKMLANGGLNFSVLDGWWAEAFTPDVGWAIGDGREHGPEHDPEEADQLYTTLEQQIVPEFYTRDENGVPVSWIQRVRDSMAKLTPQFSSARMLHDYVEKAYVPCASEYRRRSAEGGVGAERLRQWSIELEENWQSVRFGDIRHKQVDGGYRFDVQVFAGDLDPEAIRVELYAEPNGTGPERIVMHRQSPIPGAINAYCYVAEVPPTRPPEHYTVRLVGGAEGAHVPLEDSHVRWQR